MLTFCFSLSKMMKSLGFFFSVDGENVYFLTLHMTELWL